MVPSDHDGLAPAVATLGGGCFWCLEAVFERLKGVASVVSGYAGGHVSNPTYEQVCGKKTGHAEVVQVTFSPAIVTYREVLEVFFAIHDPTTYHRQGNDIGPQYRSAIFYHTEEQKQTALQVIAECTGVFPEAIVTEVVPLTTFYPAEAYHQGYYRDNPHQSYCTYVVAPKVAKFRSLFAEKFQ